MVRDCYIDTLKFVLIVLVVWGHILGEYSFDGSFSQAAYNTIYLFHMPVFLFISGRYSHVHDKKRYLSGILKLVETYLFFQIVLSLVFSFLGEPLSMKVLTEPAFALWYLLALIYYRIVIYFFYDRLKRHPVPIMIICLAISLASGIIPIGKPFSIQRSLAFLPFFFAGFYSCRLNLEKAVKRIPVLVAAAFLLAIFALFYFFLNRSLNSVLLCVLSYSEGGFAYLNGLAYRALFILAAAVTGIMFMRCVQSNKTMGKYGEASLSIYIYHQFALLALFAVIKRLALPTHVFVTFLYALTIAWILAILSRTAIFKIGLNPVSSILKKK